MLYRTVTVPYSRKFNGVELPDEKYRRNLQPVRDITPLHTTRRCSSYFVSGGYQVLEPRMFKTDNIQAVMAFTIDNGPHISSSV